MLVCAALWFAPGAFAANRLYWGTYYGNTISFASLGGSGGADLNTAGATASIPAGTAIDPAADKIYWVNQGANTIRMPSSTAAAAVI